MGDKMRKVLIGIFSLIYIGILSFSFLCLGSPEISNIEAFEYWRRDGDLDLQEALMKYTEYDYNSAYQVEYFSDRILSLRVDYLHRKNEGFKNIDMKTGKVLCLEDVFHCRRYKDMISNYVYKNYGEKLDRNNIVGSKFFFNECGVVVLVGEKNIKKYTIPKEIMSRRFKSKGEKKNIGRYIKIIK